MNIFRDSVVVNIEKYYYHGELDELKQFVLNYDRIILKKKLFKINQKIKKM